MYLMHFVNFQLSSSRPQIIQSNESGTYYYAVTKASSSKLSTGAEVVAASKGKAVNSLPKELASWVEQQQKGEIAKLAPVATKAVSRILNGPKSELQELWQENKKDFPSWKSHMQNLLARLK